jgi:hypothetical protein
MNARKRTTIIGAMVEAVHDPMAALATSNSDVALIHRWLAAVQQRRLLL